MANKPKDAPQVTVKTVELQPIQTNIRHLGLKTQDSMADVTADGYFDSMSGYLQPGDIITVAAGPKDSAPEIAEGRVASVSKGKVTVEWPDGKAGSATLLKAAKRAETLSQAAIDASRDLQSLKDVLGKAEAFEKRLAALEDGAEKAREAGQAVAAEVGDEVVSLGDRLAALETAAEAAKTATKQEAE